MLTNRRKFMLGGLVALGVAADKPAQPVQPAAAVIPVPALAPQRDQLVELLSDAQTALARMRDYTCTFTKQERVNGMLSAEQVAVMKVRVQPFSIHVRYASPASLSGQQMVFSPRSDGKMRYRPAGTSSTAPSMLLLVDDPKVLSTNRRPVTKIGMASVLETLNSAVSRERSLNNSIEVSTTDFEFANRPVTRYEIYTRRPHTFRAFYKAVVYIDKETKLLMRYEAYDQGRGGSTGDLLEMYSYTDVRANTGLGDSVFAD